MFAHAFPSLSCFATAVGPFGELNLDALDDDGAKDGFHAELT